VRLSTKLKSNRKRFKTLGGVQRVRGAKPSKLVKTDTMRKDLRAILSCIATHCKNCCGGIKDGIRNCPSECLFYIYRDGKSWKHR